MFESSGTRERDALAPLLAIARSKSGAEREEWLADLRTDAPTVVRRLERLLAEHERTPVQPAATPTTPASTRFARMLHATRRWPPRWASGESRGGGMWRPSRAFAVFVALVIQRASR